MNKKLCVACAGTLSLMALGCSDYNISGSSEDPNVLTAQNDSSSSSSDYGLSSAKEVLPNSSESVSSSSRDVSSSSLDVPGPLSSSSMNVSSSSITLSSSSISNPPILCKATYSGGCAISFDGDLWDGLGYYESYGMNVGVAKFAEDPSKLGRDAGKWFWETDSADGGKSLIEWPVELGDEYSADALDPVVEQCNGLCGVARLAKGDLTYYPFVSIGFNVAGFDSNGVALSADISNWNGICIAYTSDVAPTLSLDLGDSLNQELRMALPSVALPKTMAGTSKCIEWSKFEMPSWSKNYKYKITGEEAAKHVVRIVFTMQNQPNNKGFAFSILAVGTNLD